MTKHHAFNMPFRNNIYYLVAIIAIAAAGVWMKGGPDPDSVAARSFYFVKALLR